MAGGCVQAASPAGYVRPTPSRWLQLSSDTTGHVAHCSGPTSCNRPDPHASAAGPLMPRADSPRCSSSRHLPDSLAMVLIPRAPRPITLTFRLAVFCCPARSACLCVCVCVSRTCVRVKHHGWWGPPVARSPAARGVVREALIHPESAAQLQRGKALPQACQWAALLSWAGWLTGWAADELVCWAGHYWEERCPLLTGSVPLPLGTGPPSSCGQWTIGQWPSAAYCLPACHC